MRLDKQNGNTLWKDYMNKEFENYHIVFDLLDRG